MGLKCVMCGKESEEYYTFVGYVCLDCFMKVGDHVCCICGRMIDGKAEEYWDVGLIERDGVIIDRHGLICEECVSRMVRCKKCSWFVFPERAVDYVEVGTGRVTGEKLCYDCYEDFVKCSKCGGLIPRSIKNVEWDEDGRVICLICAEELKKVAKG